MRDFLLLGLKYLSIINEIRTSTDPDRICYLKKYKLPAATISFGCNLPTIRAV